MPITTQVDIENQHNWDTRVQEYDDEGVLLSSNTTYDNGIEITRTFGDDPNNESIRVVVAEQRYDHADVAGWSAISTNFLTPWSELQSVPWQVITEFDDGRVKTETVEEGFYQSVLEEDLLDAYSWHSKETYVEDNSNFLVLTTVLDDETRSVAWYNIEANNIIVLSSIETTDEANAYDWASRTSIYDDEGHIQTFSLAMDDGIEFVTDYENGQRAYKATFDRENLYDWDVAITSFNDTGQVTVRSTFFDDGTEKRSHYAEGVLTDINRSDIFNSRTWDTIDTAYATNGLKTERTTTYDNGIVRVELWDQNGDRSLRSEVDVQDARSWDSRVTTYSDTGEITLTETTLDSGDEIIFAYQADGDRDVRIHIDNDDSHSWAYRVTEYDDQGLNPTSTNYQSLGDVPEEYLPYLIDDMVLL